MADKTDNMMQEYLTIRNRIDSNTKREKALKTFSITANATALAFAVSNDIKFLYFIPFFFIIPISARIAYYKRSTIKQKAYIIVFLEPYLEGINYEVTSEMLYQYKISRKITALSILMQLDSIFLLTVSLALYYDNFLNVFNWTFYDAFILCLLALEFFIAFYTAYIDSTVKKWIEKWQILKNIIDNGKPNAKSNFTKKTTLNFGVTTQYFHNN